MLYATAVPVRVFVLSGFTVLVWVTVNHLCTVFPFHKTGLCLSLRVCSVPVLFPTFLALFLVPIPAVDYVCNINSSTTLREKQNGSSACGGGEISTEVLTSNSCSGLVNRQWGINLPTDSINGLKKKIWAASLHSEKHQQCCGMQIKATPAARSTLIQWMSEWKGSLLPVLRRRRHCVRSEESLHRQKMASSLALLSYLHLLTNHLLLAHTHSSTLRASLFTAQMSLERNRQKRKELCEDIINDWSLLLL